MKTTYALTLALIATAALGEICDRTKKSDGGCSVRETPQQLGKI